MILLDTDHTTILRYWESPRHDRLMDRLRSASDPVAAITVITLEEQFRGWLAEINRAKDLHEQVDPYARLIQVHEFLADWSIVPFTEEAAAEFKRLRKEKVRIGTQDLKIASIALVHDALLLSANLSDFHKVPGLRVENWLE